MKSKKKLLALCLALVLCVSCVVPVSAANVSDATIDTAAKGSLTLYKYDLTNGATRS